MDIIENIKQKASFLNNLSNNEQALFDFINKSKPNLNEVIQMYQPHSEFRPVNTLRFLIANELRRDTVITKALIKELKQAIEARDVSKYYELNDTVKESIVNYKDSKTGMFPNWRHTFKILFPFLHSKVDNEEVLMGLNTVADEIITANQLQDVHKHIVGFQGAQNYGTDLTWLAIIPKSAPSVQYAYQLFFRIDQRGIKGGIHKGHNLIKQNFDNQDLSFNTWEDYLEHTKQTKSQWSDLNAKINFIFMNDEKAFIKALKKVDGASMSDYFNTLERFKTDLDIQDEEKLVFSIAKNRLSFQVGKRYCLNLNKNHFDFISNTDIEGDSGMRETFSGTGSTYLYKERTIEEVLSNYDDIKSAVENEIERDNHALAKFYDNSAFRKAFFDKDYRAKVLGQFGIQNKYFLVGAYWEDHMPQDQTERFLSNSIWVNGYDDKFIDLVDQVSIGNNIAIKTVDRKGDKMFIKARGTVLENLGDGQNLRVRWEENFKEFKVDFSGGYWDTIKEVKKENHINAIWSNNENMENVKQEFIKWFYALPIRKYTALSKEDLSVELDNSNNYFDIDIFNVKESNYIEIVSFLKQNINIKDSAFYKFSSKIFNHRPRALLGKENYIKFLLEKFGSLSISKGYYHSPLNQIFYGPPGTGKTYSTILEATKIVTQNEYLSYDEAQTIFNNNLGDQIEFITFHQNYSYEDFIQGLRPDVKQKELSFNRADGIFTKMVTKALFEYYKVHQQTQKSQSNETATKIDLNDAFIEFVNSLEEGQEFETKTGSKIKVDNFTDRQNIEFKPINGIKTYLVSGNRLLKLYDAYNDITKIKRVHEDIINVIGGCNATIYYVALREFIDFLKVYEDTLTEFDDEEEGIDYENITYSRKKELLSTISLDDIRAVSENKVPKYVIIIDEINRANISRVFGELITLIEKDKRSHGKIPLKATLPSGEPFVVPSNLYIIGTMNTADKSIALLDIALRRRFEFKAMYPKYEISDKTIYKAEFLKKLNDLIVASGKGYDFTIGHSYFMESDDADFDFTNTINNKVIPLMLEYYMNDENEVKKLLNEALKEEGCKIENWPLEMIYNGN